MHACECELCMHVSEVVHACECELCMHVSVSCACM